MSAGHSHYLSWDASVEVIRHARALARSAERLSQRTVPPLPPDDPLEVEIAQLRGHCFGIAMRHALALPEAFGHVAMRAPVELALCIELPAGTLLFEGLETGSMELAARALAAAVERWARLRQGVH